MKCGAENTVQNAEERVIIKTKFVEKQIEKITTFIINSNYSRKPKSLEMLNYIKE